MAHCGVSCFRDSNHVVALVVVLYIPPLSEDLCTSVNIHKLTKHRKINVKGEMKDTIYLLALDNKGYYVVWVKIVMPFVASRCYESRNSCGCIKAEVWTVGDWFQLLPLSFVVMMTVCGERGRMDEFDIKFGFLRFLSIRSSFCIAWVVQMSCYIVEQFLRIFRELGILQLYQHSLFNGRAALSSVFSWLGRMGREHIQAWWNFEIEMVVQSVYECPHLQAKV